MLCWSACRCDCSALHQYDATPHERPPSSERKRSTPAANTRSGSTGSTAIVLQYQPIVSSLFAPLVHSCCVAVIGFERMSELSLSALASDTRAVHVPRSPLLSD